jgi:Zn-dependent M28 family amino/carboxypeptidase
MRLRNHWGKLFAVCLVVLATSATLCAQDFTLPGDAHHAADAITAQGLRAHVRFLGDDMLEGRAPARRGDELAELYLSTELEALGYQPGAPGGKWLQSFGIVGVDSKTPATWSFRAPKGHIDLRYWDDYIAASGVQTDKAAIENAEIVFVGYGIQAPEYEWDDFKGADLHGKVLLIMNNDPDWDPKLFEGETRLYYGRWTYKYEEAARLGAAGAIIIHTTPSAGYPWQVVQTSWSGMQWSLPNEGRPTIQVEGWVSEDSARKLVGLSGFNLDKLREMARSRSFKPLPLGITTSLMLTNTVAKAETANVLGLLPGSDPKLKDEAVVISAHHDHLGIGKPDATGDSIYNGALDNGAGCSQVLEIAKAFTRLVRQPRRSILIAFVAAEEQGLLGSQYYAEHPTFPPGKIAANLNYDAGNIFGRTKDLAFIGYGKSSLDAIVRHFAAEQGLTVKGDQFPDRGSFYRSDQFSFAKIGVPAFYTSSGTDFVGRPEGWGREQVEKWIQIHYHQPSDQLTNEWNFGGMIDNSRIGFFTALAVAQSDSMPTWNPGDEFEAVRKKALAHVQGR